MFKRAENTTSWTMLRALQENIPLPDNPREGDVVTLCREGEGGCSPCRWMLSECASLELPPGNFTSSVIYEARIQKRWMEGEEVVKKLSVRQQNEESASDGAWVAAAEYENASGVWKTAGPGSLVEEGNFKGWRRILKGAIPPVAPGQTQCVMFFTEEDPEFCYYRPSLTNDPWLPPEGAEFSSAEVREICSRVTFSFGPLLKYWKAGRWYDSAWDHIP